MDGRAFGPALITSFGFQSGAVQAPPGHVPPAEAPQEPDRGEPERLPDREWGLTPVQVVAVVLVIVAACQAIGVLG